MMMTSTDLASSISQLLQLEMQTRQQAAKSLSKLLQEEAEWSMPRKVDIVPRRAAEWGSMPRKVSSSHFGSTISGQSTCDASDTRSNPGSDPGSPGTPTDVSFLGSGGFALPGFPAPAAHLSLASALPAPPPGLSAAPIAAPAAAAQDKPKQVCTLKIKNLPRRCTQQEILNAVEDIGFGDGYDFFFLPVGPQSKQNRGYAFMNFRDPVTAANFRQAFAGYQIREKAVEVVAAPVQGLAENMMRYSKQNENGEWTYPRMLVL
mmetsp:Transcript_106137/g.228657  ORF Transcript_106137/g.228657 Transcript_106137/m.228657 type:complete len:262 (+) Transcript_106137:64-849(+)